jgi:hypothetical protein
MLNFLKILLIGLFGIILVGFVTILVLNLNSINLGNLDIYIHYIDKFLLNFYENLGLRLPSDASSNFTKSHLVFIYSLTILFVSIVLLLKPLIKFFKNKLLTINL